MYQLLKLSNFKNTEIQGLLRFISILKSGGFRLCYDNKLKKQNEKGDKNKIVFTNLCSWKLE